MYGSLRGFSSISSGIGNVFSALILGTARNPSASAQLMQQAIFGFALTEAVACVPFNRKFGWKCEISFYHLS